MARPLPPFYAFPEDYECVLHYIRCIMCVQNFQRQLSKVPRHTMWPACISWHQWTSFEILPYFLVHQKMVILEDKLKNRDEHTARTYSMRHLMVHSLGAKIGDLPNVFFL